LLLGKEGAKVVITDIDEINANGGDAIFLKHDVSNEENWKRVIEQTLWKFSKLDILVNNAGVLLVKNVENTSLEEWRWPMNINLDGVFLGTKCGIEAMKKSSGGSIINLSSIEGIIGNPNHAAYDASKGGVRIFTKSAAIDCAQADYNIRVNSVHPGSTWTPFLEEDLKSRDDIEAMRKFQEGLHPIGHIGEPADVAYGVLYLASDESKFITGVELVIDGGYTAQ
jgi:NAD(P)-dependent dehydrogenase (short-subunit alcohol dehydrogenase family)